MMGPNELPGHEAQAGPVALASDSVTRDRAGPASTGTPDAGSRGPGSLLFLKRHSMQGVFCCDLDNYLPSFL